MIGIYSTRFLRDISVPLGISASLLALGALIVWDSRQAVNRFEKEHREAQATIEEVHRKLQDADTDKARITHQIQVLQHLSQQGVIGGQLTNREDFLREIASKLHILEIRPDFGTGKALDSTPPGQPVWYSTPLHLQLEPAHEEDLLRFLDALQQKAPAIIRIRRCALSSVQAAATSETGTDTAPNKLLGDCDLDWLTIEAAP